MQKRGLSHIEVILAFVLFVGFLIFGLYFFNPLDSGRVVDSSLIYTINEIVENTSAFTLRYAVSLNTSKESVEFPLPRENTDGGGFRVETHNGERIVSRYDGINVAFDRVDDFVYITFGPFESEQGEIGNFQRLNSREYSLSSSNREKVIIEGSFEDLNRSYYSDYYDLKKEFNIPNRIDFSAEIVFADGQKISLERSAPVGLDVFSKVERKKVMRNDGRLEFADLTVKVW